MERHRTLGSFRMLLALLALTLACLAGPSAVAQQARRLVRNPVTGRLEPVVEPTRIARRAAAQAKARRGSLAMPAPPQENHQVEPAGYIDAPCDDLCCDIGCGDAVCGVPEDCCSCGVPEDCPSCGLADDCCECEFPCQPCCKAGGFFAGFEAVIVQPRFGSNEAFSLMSADGGSFESFSSHEFNYDLDFSPRVYLGWQNSSGLGFRAAWWQFDHAANSASTSPPANGFGRVDSPPFGDVDVSSTIPTDVFTANANLNAYTIDMEFTKSASFSAWDLGVGCGFRYASAEQSYRAQLVNAADVLRGTIDYSHKLDGYGPTVSMDAYRRVYSDAGIFCKARGSALFGEGSSRMVAGEDLDLTTPFTTTSVTRRDDLLPVGELQVGFRWAGTPRRGQVFRPVVSLAMEGQVWHGAGNASSEDGSLGFYGFNAGAGLNW